MLCLFSREMRSCNEIAAASTSTSTSTYPAKIPKDVEMTCRLQNSIVTINSRIDSLPLPAPRFFFLSCSFFFLSLSFPFLPWYWDWYTPMRCSWLSLYSLNFVMHKTYYWTVETDVNDIDDFIESANVASSEDWVSEVSVSCHVMSCIYIERGCFRPI